MKYDILMEGSEKAIKSYKSRDKMHDIKTSRLHEHVYKLHIEVWCSYSEVINTSHIQFNRKLVLL